MGGFEAFLLPQILRKRAETTEMIVLPLPPFKIHCETLRKRHGEAQREHAEGQAGKPLRPESGGDDQYLTV